uniref:R3H domain and coiled-coil containing 1 n=1 Tax=Taeniopygia guttata TaxID=59729 RepID=A0A674HBU5_TAEGU|nr:R3H and coiled-coil domain-containing protein 1 [Taeniopygia guttata]XP_041576509.1 R3H and coiled-coil domain-containing protein 1 [Taeniopygia guttata]
MDGVFLSPSEDEFVGRIAEELEQFLGQGQHQRVLLFPPLSSRLRYLIHRTVENMELLSSFSVGEGWRRRTVICHSAVRLPSEAPSDPKPGSGAARPQRPAQPWGRGGRGARLRHPGDTHGDSARASVGSGRITRPPRKKPDKALYVPRGISQRKKANWREREAEPDGDAAPGGENCPRNSMRDNQQELGKAGDSAGKQQEEPEDVPGNGSAEHPPCDEKVPKDLGNSHDSCEQESRDKDCSHSLTAAHNKHPPEAAEQESSHASTTIPEGSEFQEEKQSRRDSGGSERGKGSSPLENHGGSRTELGGTELTTGAHPGSELTTSAQPGSELTTSAQPGSEMTTRAQRGSELTTRAQSGTELTTGAQPGSDQPVAVTDPALAESPLLETQSLESSRNLAEQDSRSAEEGRGDLGEQGSPSTGQLEQKPLQKVLEGPGEALAAPELLRGEDPSAPGRICSRKVPGEEEEDKERSDVAEALWRDLDLAAGDREGTRQSGLEDDCTAELLAEIVGNLTVKDISIERISVDYSGYGEAQVSEGDLGHVTEIYDFPSSLKTEDLMEMFSDFHESGFKIQWVDDTHALGIFSSLSTASQALGRRYPCLRIRPLIHASKQAKLKALQRPKLLQLGKERPQTDTAVARRLVSHALGWRHRQHEAAGNEVFQPESLDQEE